MVRVVEKGWGREIIYADEPEYCGKLMVYDKVGATSSMHFHQNKKESWYVQQGSFKYLTIDPTNAKLIEVILNTGNTVLNKPLQVHQLIALEDNSVIFEVSTKDSVEDNYRVIPGDSQREILS